jgi:flagellar basal body-associated protein FliL
MKIPRALISCVLAAVASSLAAGGAASAAETEKKKGGGLSYIQLPALTATVMRPTGRRGVLTVEVGLDVPDTKLHDRAAASTPRLRDAYVRYMQIYAASIPPGGLPNPDAIGSALQRSTDQVLAQPGARLLLGTIMVN